MGRPVLLGGARGREATVLLPHPRAFLDALATDIPGGPRHKPPDLIGTIAAERAAQPRLHPQQPWYDIKLHSHAPIPTIRAGTTPGWVLKFRDFPSLPLQRSPVRLGTASQLASGALFI